VTVLQQTGGKTVSISIRALRKSPVGTAPNVVMPAIAATNATVRMETTVQIASFSIRARARRSVAGTGIARYSARTCTRARATAGTSARTAGAETRVSRRRASTEPCAGT
jgi:hypothetical protein